jgi:hypothetical protein
MKSTNILARAVLAAAVLAVTVGRTTPLIGQTAPATDVAGLTQAINQAPDPSAAVQAYARATVVAPYDLSIEGAYLHRMVAFGLPEMADTQATDLTQRSPGDGEAWAVAAYMIAKKSQGGSGTAWGIMDADLAVVASPDDPFVVRTAAQLVAWYDVRADKSQVAAAAQKAAESIRQKLASNPTYAEAYARANTDYLKMAGTAAAPPEAAPQVVEAAPAPSTYVEVPTPVVVPYPEPYLVSPYDDYWYPDWCIGTNWWFPGFFVGGIVIGDEFHHHRDFDGDRDDFGRRFDGGRNTWVRDPARSGSFTAAPAPRAPVSSGTTSTAVTAARAPLAPVSSGARTTAVTAAPRATVDPAPATSWTFRGRSTGAIAAAPATPAPRVLSVPAAPRISTFRAAPSISSFSAPAAPRISSFSAPSRSFMSASPHLSAPSMGGGGMRVGGGGEFHGGGGGGFRGGGGGGFAGGRR